MSAKVRLRATRSDLISTVALAASPPSVRKGCAFPERVFIDEAMKTSRVLVVDDNVDAADMLVMMLQMFGHEVKAAYSGQAALETAVEYQPDFVLLDIGLPDMNGYEVAQHLRQQERLKNVSLIAMTGYGQDSDRQRSEEAGIDLHLVKPVDPKKLQDLLETWAREPCSRK